MRILLDESLPREERFDVLVTGDQNIDSQQNPARLPIAVVILVAVSNRIESLRPLLPELLQVLTHLPARGFVHVGSGRLAK